MKEAGKPPLFIADDGLKGKRRLLFHFNVPTVLTALRRIYLCPA
jgi:hypothetical protein